MKPVRLLVKVALNIFENAVKILFYLISVSCEEPHNETRKLSKRIDLVLEHMKDARLCLAIIDKNLPEGKAKEIRETGMIVYVTDELKMKFHLRNKPWIRKLSNLPKDIKITALKPKHKKLYED